MPRRNRRRRPQNVTSQQPPSEPPSSNVSVVDNDEGGGVSPPKSSPRPRRDMYGLIEDKRWDEALKLCRDYPQEARWKIGAMWLPIHGAILRNAPLDLVRCLHEAYEEGVRTTDDFGVLPLHLACCSARGGASLAVIRYIHGLHPDAATEKIRDGRTPVDLVNSNKMLSREDKAAARAILLSDPPVARTPSPREQPPTTHTPSENDTTTSAALSITNTTSATEASRAEVDVAEVAMEAAETNEASEEAGASAGGPEAAEAEAGAAARAARDAWKEAASRRAAAKEEARFGRRRAEVADWNAARLRREAEAARGTVGRTAVAVGDALARRHEGRYDRFAEDRDRLELPFFLSTRRRSPSVILHEPTPRQAMAAVAAVSDTAAKLE